MKVESLIQQLDLTFCEILTLALLQTSRSEGGLTTLYKPESKLHSLAYTHLPRVALWIEDTLRSKVSILPYFR